MKSLVASLTLCALLTLSRAIPINSTVAKQTGLCEYMRQHNHNTIGEFVPQCDAHGNFLPQQCSGSTGYCWCVDVITGEEIPNTRTPPGTIPVNCAEPPQLSLPDADAVVWGEERRRIDTEFYCPYSWSRFGKQCYIFIDSPKTWFEAEGYCLFERANLASIHSNEESHFIQDLTRQYTHDFPEAWIGGHDAIHPCFWMWSDGSKFDYENWYKEYEVERTEHCLKINYGYMWKWNYGACNETLPFVCAKRI